jgi:hypothetical protein
MIDKPSEVPLKKRWLLYSGAWGIAFLCLIIPHPPSIVFLIWFLPFFPIGLLAWFNPRSENLVLTGLIWLAYIAHGFFILTSRDRVRFYRLLLILAIFLLLNVIGCYRVDVKFN